MSNIKTIEIIVTGRVQGVYFRQSAASFAQSLRLTGYVENLPDGSVKIIGQGNEDALEELLKWSQRGSLLAKVMGMSYKWLEESEEYKDFQIKRSGSLITDQVQSFFHLGKRIGNKLNPLGPDVNIPNHVVIIPNGNRTWAKARGMKSWEAYWHVQKNLENLINSVRDLSIKHLTFWGFSTENWKRSTEEVEQLMKVFETTILKFHDKLIQEKVRFRHLGRKDRLPDRLVQKITELEEATKEFTDRSLNIALDYGGRDEILRAIGNIIKSGKTEISEEEFSKLLDTEGLPDPDLIIRTAGEKRLSGMMPWQAVYSEFYSSNVYFPEFGLEHLKEAIYDYSSRKRTFGGDIDINKKKQEAEENMAKNLNREFALNV